MTQANLDQWRALASKELKGADPDSLNWETLEGIAKHNGPVARPAHWALEAYDARHPLDLGSHASAEAQVAAVADDVDRKTHV